VIKKSPFPVLGLFALLAVAGPAAAAAVDLEYFNVKSYGAVGNGIADDTAAINSALSAARTAGRGTVFFPAGIYKTSGSHDLSGTNGLRILGSGMGATVLKMADATHDLFFSNTDTTDLTLQDFSVTSDPGVRTAGWVYHAGGAYNATTGSLKRSRLESIDVKKQVNAFWIAQYEYVWLKNLMLTNFVGSGGTAIKVGQTTLTDHNQGSELYILGTQINGQDLVNHSDPLVLAYGIWIEDTDAVYIVNSGVGATLNNNLRITANAGGHGPMNFFFDQLISDATLNSHGVYITGGGAVYNLKFTGSWFASAGKAIPGGSLTANGIRMDVASLGFVEITGSKIVNNSGTGLYLATHATNAAITFTGNLVWANGSGGQVGNTDGIYVDVPINNLGPVITGNQDTYEPGVSLRTSATANRLVIVGNRFVSGVSFGIPPNVQGLNEGVN